MAASLTGQCPIWDRSFKVTRRPKTNLLARQILDPNCFAGLYELCLTLATSCSAATGLLVTRDEIEGILRFWADAADFTPEGQIELLLFPALDKKALSFEGWPVSPDSSLDVLADLDDDDE